MPSSIDTIEPKPVAPEALTSADLLPVAVIVALSAKTPPEIYCTQTVIGSEPVARTA